MATMVHSKNDSVHSLIVQHMSYEGEGESEGNLWGCQRILSHGLLYASITSN